MSVLLQLRGVRKSFGDEVKVEVLHGIDLELHEGEMTALIGPSGSGKSTLLNQIGLLDRPTDGTINLLGTDIGGLDDERLTTLRGTRLGFIFQFHHLLSALNVLEMSASVWKRRIPGRPAEKLTDTSRPS